MRIFNIKLALFLLVTIGAGVVVAQDDNGPEPHLNNPYNTIYVHLYYLQPDTYDPDISALTMPPELDSAQAVKRALQIKQVLDGRGLFVPLSRIPRDSLYRDSMARDFIYTPFPDKLPEVYVQRIEGKWYYSPETADIIPTVHRKLFPFGADILVNILPQYREKQFLGLALWQWIGILLLIAVCFVAHFILSHLIRPIIRLIAGYRRSLYYISRESMLKLARYLSIFLILWLVRLFLPSLLLPIKLSAFANNALEIIGVIVFVLLASVIVRIIMDHARTMAEKTESRMDDQVLPIISKSLNILIVIIGIFYILRLLSVNVTALIAGLSIGGLALALAAQDTVKNLIGSVMIFFDKPFQVGDYILANGLEGTIVEVGFRSTRIMKIDTSIVSVPNGTISNMSLENYGVRSARMMNIMIGVTYQTPADKIEEFVAALRQIGLDHHLVLNDPLFVHFRELSASSLNILFRCYIEVATFAEELVIREELLLKIVRTAEEVGVEFAYPTQTLHFAPQSPDMSQA